MDEAAAEGNWVRLCIVVVRHDGLLSVSCIDSRRIGILIASESKSMLEPNN